MTFPSGSGLDQADMLRRLRARPVSSWAHGSRDSVMRAALQRVADLTAASGGADAGGASQSARRVPDVGVAAMPDQLAVLLADARASGVSGELLAELLAGLAAKLGVR